MFIRIINSIFEAVACSIFDELLNQARHKVGKSVGNDLKNCSIVQ